MNTLTWLLGRYARPVALFVVALALILLLVFARNIWLALRDDWDQLFVAAAAAAVMGSIGAWLTLGRGVLAGSSQYDRLLVWSALGLSVVSAVTTTTGLQQMLSANAGTATLLQVGLAFALGISIQAFMLNNALRIGEGIQRLVPHKAVRDEDETWHDPVEDRPAAQRRPSLAVLLTFAALLLIGVAILANASLADLWSLVLRAVGSAPASTTLNPIGLLLVAVALILLVRSGILPAAATLTGLALSLAVYLGMLLFSSGFGYMFYFVSVQSEEVIATDRDAYIRNRTPELVNRIEAATRDDVREAQLRARSGAAFQDLSRRVNDLAAIFRDANADITAARDAYALRRQEIQRRKEDAARQRADAQQAVTDAEVAVDQAQEDVNEAQRERANRQPDLQDDYDDAVRRRDAELTGSEEGTGIAGRGPVWNEQNDLAEDIRQELDQLDEMVADAKRVLGQRQSELSQAEARLQTLTSDTDETGQEPPLPPEIVDPESFTAPRDAYVVEPSPGALREIARACNAGIQVLISAGLDQEGLPSCDISGVEADLRDYLRAQQALEEIRKAGICTRTGEERAADEAGRLAYDGARIDTIPEYLRQRIQWVVRCVDAANTGSPRMQAVVRDVERLESEYLTPGYDLRRILSAPFNGNRFAIFAAILAVVVDTAILFAGIGANAQRGRELREDHRLVPADRLADRVRRILALIDPVNPERFAIQLLMRADPRPFSPGQTSPFTHDVDLTRLARAEVEQIKMVMTAVGPDFARYMDHSGRRFWRLHTNLMALLTEIAAGAASGSSHPADEGGSGGGEPARPVVGPGGGMPGPGGAAAPLAPNYASGSALPKPPKSGPAAPKPGPGYDPLEE